MAQTSRLVLEIDSRDAEQKAADTRKALEALEGAGLRVKPAMDKAGSGMDGAGKSAEAAGKSFSSQREEIEQLLGRISPLSKQLGDLDRQEQELARHRKSGAIDLETYTEYQQKITSTRNDLTRFNDSLTRTGNTAKQTAAALRGVPAQFTDIAVSLQGGQAPLTVFLQQGGQLKDMFGGAGPAAKALGGYVLGLVNPFTVAAAAVGVLGLAYYQGSKEQDAFRLSLVSTGNASGTTTGALAEMAKRIGDIVGTTGQAASALAQLAASGKIASSSFEQIAIAAISWEKASGQAVSTTVAEFNKLADDPVKAIVELNDKYNFLTASVYEQVRAAQEQGDKQAAAAIAEEAYAKALTERAGNIKQNLGTLERAWNDLAGAAKSGWDAILDIGRESNKGPDLAAIQQKINYLKSTLDTGFEDGNARQRIAALQAELDGYAKKAKAEQDAAAAAAHAAQVQRDGQIAYEAFQKSVEQNFTKRQKMNKALEDEEKRINVARAAGYGISEEQAAASLKAIRENPIYKESAPKKEKSYTEDAGQKMLDQARQQYAVLQQQNSLLGQQGEGSKALGAEAKRLLELEQQIADLKEKKTLTAAQKQILAMADLNIAQQKQNAALERENQLKKTSTEQTQKLLAFQENLNSQLTLAQSGLDQKLAGAGLGDRALQRLQEQQQIQQSYQSQMDRLTYDYNKSDKTTGTTDLYNKETEALRAALQQRLTMQQGYYAAVDQAQSDWSLGASSALQTYAEQANDVAGQTRNLFTNAFGNMEDAVVNFVKTGKLSFKDFADGVISDLIRIQIHQAAAGFLGMAFGAITGGGGAALGPAVMTGSSQTISRVDFSGGGYTGDGGKFEPKGVVHGGEFVVKKEVVSQPGAREFLERMNANSNGYADGGYVNPTAAAAASSTTQSVAVNGGSPSITQQFSFQGSPDDATISLVKDAAYQGAKGGYEMVMRDLKQNGPIRQLIARR
ncbi:MULTISPECIES: phage tail tape measure protein [Pseudomonas]|uniref:phage tail tape measure protein n=1 Tax=Pseudomonas TaxID=286 RepID=UPI0015E35319|nr:MULTISPECIES: phage tail tape measure protein [Pseudomonas]MBA1270907.1 phage tail tape measure protein [Pseudomonas carnis]MCP9736537.1 phage tail tape measure protein [Pseudomonas sp. GBPI_506]